MSEDKRNESDVTGRLAYFLVGAGVGAVVALLFAPKSGQELRTDIADATRKGVDRSREAAAQAGTRAGEYYDTTREKVTELYSTTADKTSGLVEAARESATRKRDQIAAAIDAGKQAYSEEKQRTEPASRES
ncbi:MAG: YtxH domain-containing protein [Pyrinomonadaceae bacterium]